MTDFEVLSLPAQRWYRLAKISVAMECGCEVAKVTPPFFTYGTYVALADSGLGQYII